MKFIDKYRWPIVLGVIVLVLGIIAFNSNSDSGKTEDQKKSAAQTSEQQKKAEQTKKDEAQKAQSKAANYTYNARMGDSYTVLARKAIQAYANETKTKLSQAQIIAAETQLTITAGAPLLEIQQKVTMAKNTISLAVSAAQKLTADEQAAWQAYVPYVDFDTSKNG